MSNCVFLFPTVNKENFNENFIKDLIIGKFPKYKIDIGENEISVYNKKDTFPFSLWIKDAEECYLLSFEDYDDADTDENIIALKNANLDSGVCLSYSHPFSMEGQSAKRDIEILLHGYFKAYILDEGIHPEHISPDYVWKKK
jgi:hypothetical protein